MSDRHGLRPDLLRAFIAVHETGGFTRAGKRLHLSQSAVSHQIRRLEEQAGTALLKRTTRSLTLTEDGEEFLRHAEQILRAQDALAIRFQRSAVTGAVRFGVPESYVGDRLPPMLARFAPVPREAGRDGGHVSGLARPDRRRPAGPAVTLSLDEDPASPLLRRTRFVWAAGRGRCGHACAAALALAPKPCLHREVATRALEEAGREWRLAFTSLSQQGLRAAVKAGRPSPPFSEDRNRESWRSTPKLACRPCRKPASGCSGARRKDARRAGAGGQLIESCVAASA